MKKTFLNLVFGGLCAAILVTTANAQTTKTKAPDAKAREAADAAKPKRDWYPFYGTVTNIDKSAKTVSLARKEGSRLLATDDKTTLEMNGKPASFSDIKAGNYLHGKLHKVDGAEYILDAKVEKTAPAHMSHVEKAREEAAPAAADTSTNAPAKKKKKATTTQ